MRLLDRLLRRAEPGPTRPASHRAKGASTYQQIRAHQSAPTSLIPAVVDGPVLLTPARAHDRAATYRSAYLPTPDEVARAAALEQDTRPIGRAELRDALDGGEPSDAIRPYTQAKPA